MRARKSSSSTEGHTHLYIAVAILVIFAVIFFIYQAQFHKKVPSADTTPTISEKTTLTTSERKLQEEIIASESLVTYKLSAQQVAAQKKAMTEMGITSQ